MDRAGRQLPKPSQAGASQSFGVGSVLHAVWAGWLVMTQTPLLQWVTAHSLRFIQSASRLQTALDSDVEPFSFCASAWLLEWLEFSSLQETAAATLKKQTMPPKQTVRAGRTPLMIFLAKITDYSCLGAQGFPNKETGSGDASALGRRHGSDAPRQHRCIDASISR